MAKRRGLRVTLLRKSEMGSNGALTAGLLSLGEVSLCGSTSLGSTSPTGIPEVWASQVETCVHLQIILDL